MREWMLVPMGELQPSSGLERTAVRVASGLGLVQARNIQLAPPQGLDKARDLERQQVHR